MLSSLLLAPFLASMMCLVHATSPEQEILPKLQDIVALYENFQSQTPLRPYDEIVANNPVPWKGYTGYYRETLVKEYFNRLVKLDFDFLLDSYQKCKEAGELDFWGGKIGDICMKNTPLLIEYHLITSSLNFCDSLSVYGLTRGDLSVISKSIPLGCFAKNLSELIELFDDECGQPCNSGENRKALARLLRNKRYLLPVLIHALIVTLPHTDALSRMTFIRRALQMLDAENYNKFLDFLEGAGEKYGGPFDTSQWRSRSGCEEKLEAVKGEPELSDAAACSFPNYDTVVYVLRHVDWKTLMQSVPCVDKFFNSVATKIFKCSHDFAHYTLEQSFNRDPHQMSRSLPWSRAFSSSHVLIKYNAINSQKMGRQLEQRWLCSIYDCLEEEEVGVSGEQSYLCDSFLKSAVLAKLEIGSESFYDDYLYLSEENLWRVMDAVLGDSEIDDTLLAKVYNLACHRPHDNLLYCLEHTKYGAKLFRLAHSRSQYGRVNSDCFNLVIAAVLVLDDLRMPADVLWTVKDYFLETYGKRVSVPMSAEEVKASYQEIAGMLFNYVCNTLHPILSLKIMIKLSNMHSEQNFMDSWTNVADSAFYRLLEYLLFVDPAAMSVEQFQSFVSIVPSQCYQSFVEVLESAVLKNQQE